MIRNFQLQYFPRWHTDFNDTVGSAKGQIYRSVFAKAKGKCQICDTGKPKWLHPIFTIEHELKERHLKRFIAVCEDCGKLLSLEGLSDDEPAVTEFIAKLCKTTTEQAESIIEQAHSEYVSTINYRFFWTGLDFFLYNKKTVSDSPIKF
jgi:hypothetical protein